MRRLRLGSSSRTTADRLTDDGFNAFYLGERRRILLLCVAMTSDLRASRAATRDAFVAASHHWRKVGPLTDRTSWIRPRALANAHRRSATKVRHRVDGASPAQVATLDALRKLSEVQRKALVLTHLGGVSRQQLGYDLGLTQASVDGHLAKATERFCQYANAQVGDVPGRLQGLAPLVTHPGLPRTRYIRSHGRRRRLVLTIGGSVGAVVVTTAAGLAVNGHDTANQLARINQRKVGPTMLLSPEQMTQTLGGSWGVDQTDNNTSGSGIHTPCQRARFADPSGAAAWVRTMSTPSLSAVDSVEISLSQKAARQTFQTTLGWYADCTPAVAHLTGAATASGLGDEAWILGLDVVSGLNTGFQPGAYRVVVVRSGLLTTTVVLRGPLGQVTDATPTLEVASTALGNLCQASAIGACGRGTISTREALPASGETPGMLAVTDLPPLGTGPLAWVGTDPVKGGPNLSATTCDNSDFKAAGSAPIQTRTYLIPQGNLPQQFGLTETLGVFPDEPHSGAFVAGLRNVMAGCAAGHPGTTVDQQRDDDAQGADGVTAAASMWHVSLKVDATNTVVTYWMGVVQHGDVVAQVNFEPAEGADMDAATFWALVLRARARLAGLGSN